MNRMTQILSLTCLFAVSLLTGCATPQSSSPVGDTGVTAIDILLEPDATMLKHAEANNARLLSVYPEGFPLDAAHRPHITMLQCFVRTADLDKLFAAQEKSSPPPMSTQ